MIVTEIFQSDAAMFFASIIVYLCDTIFFLLITLPNKVIFLLGETGIIYISLILYSYVAFLIIRSSFKKHTNYFILNYSDTESCYTFAVIESVLGLIFLYFYNYYFVTPILIISQLGPAGGVIFAITAYYSWISIESNLFPRRFFKAMKNRISSWTIFYFIAQNNAISINYDCINVNDYSLPHRRSSDHTHYEDVSKLIVKPNMGRNIKAGKLKHMLRYHELFGKTSYIGLFVRIIISPIVALIIASIVTFLIRNAISVSEYSSLENLYDFYGEVNSVFNPVLAIFFGPAFSINPFIEYASSGRYDENMSRYISFFVVSNFIFYGILISATAKGANTGRILSILVFLYAIMMLTFITIMSTSLLNDTTYFQHILNHLNTVKQTNISGWLKWLLEYGGLYDLGKELNYLDSKKFIILSIPGIIFWILSAVLVYICTNRTNSGLITYRNIIQIPYISEGHLENAALFKKKKYL